MQKPVDGTPLVEVVDGLQLNSPYQRPRVSTIALAKQARFTRWDQFLLFSRAIFSFTGSVILWEGIWGLFDSYYMDQSLTRDMGIYFPVGLVFMWLTRTVIWNSAVELDSWYVEKTDHPLYINPPPIYKLPIWGLPIFSEFHTSVVFTLNSCEGIVALVAGIVMWIGVWNLFDLWLFPDWNANNVTPPWQYDVGLVGFSMIVLLLMRGLTGALSARGGGAAVKELQQGLRQQETLYNYVSDTRVHAFNVPPLAVSEQEVRPGGSHSTHSAYVVASGEQAFHLTQHDNEFHLQDDYKGEPGAAEDWSGDRTRGRSGSATRQIDLTRRRTVSLVNAQPNTVQARKRASISISAKTGDHRNMQHTTIANAGSGTAIQMRNMNEPLILTAAAKHHISILDYFFLFARALVTLFALVALWKGLQDIMYYYGFGFLPMTVWREFLYMALGIIIVVVSMRNVFYDNVGVDEDAEKERKTLEAAEMFAEKKGIDVEAADALLTNYRQTMEDDRLLHARSLKDRLLNFSQRDLLSGKQQQQRNFSIDQTYEHMSSISDDMGPLPVPPLPPGAIPVATLASLPSNNITTINNNATIATTTRPADVTMANPTLIGTTGGGGRFSFSTSFKAAHEEYAFGSTSPKDARGSYVPPAVPGAAAVQPHAGALSSDGGGSKKGSKLKLGGGTMSKSKNKLLSDDEYDDGTEDAYRGAVDVVDEEDIHWWTLRKIWFYAYLRKVFARERFVLYVRSAMGLFGVVLFWGGEEDILEDYITFTKRWHYEVCVALGFFIVMVTNTYWGNVGVPDPESIESEDKMPTKPMFK